MALISCRRDDLERYQGLQQCCVMIGEITEQRALLVAPVPCAEGETTEVAEWVPQVENQVGRLLLPMQMAEGQVDLLRMHRNTPAFVVYDGRGRVHQVVVDGCVFLVLMALWDCPRMETTTVEISAVDHDKARILSVDRSMTQRLALPPVTPPEFKAWQAHGLYEVTYDQYGRVHAVRAEGTDIRLTALWDTRF